jgi:hypothetical protein
MKRLIVLSLVLCVVAPASFGAYSDEYTWQGPGQVSGNGNFTDTTAWKCTNTNDPAGTASRPLVPQEGNTSSAFTNYSRPQLTNGNTITINTDLAPLNVGFNQFQIDRGTVIVDNGGRLVVGGGYLRCSNGSNANGGLIVQNGGYYRSNGTGNNGTFVNYNTANSVGALTISGAGTQFNSTMLYAARPNYATVVTSNINVLGSGSTINVGTFSMSTSKATVNWTFLTDTSSVSTINIATALALSTTTASSVLNFQLGAAPSGADIVLFDLAAAATRTGYLKNAVSGTLLGQDSLLPKVTFGGTDYWYRIKYNGGDTHNDVVLYSVPEPATLGLLSLGGLFMARRRRAQGN